VVDEKRSALNTPMRYQQAQHVVDAEKKNACADTSIQNTAYPAATGRKKLKQPTNRHYQRREGNKSFSKRRPGNLRSNITTPQRKNKHKPGECWKTYPVKHNWRKPQTGC